MEQITSVKNQKIKDYISLVSSSKNRKEQGLFVLEGLRLVMDVLRSGMSINELYFTKVLYDNNKEDIDKLISVAKTCFEINDSVALKMSDTKNPQGIFAVVASSATDKEIEKDGKYILLENVQDPANLGAISRTAEALGITGLIVSGGCDVYNTKALRASMGALLRLPVIEVKDVAETIKAAQEQGMKTYASTPNANAVSITDADFSGGVITVIGNEANGVTQSTMENCKDSITIKMTGRAESLNAGAAASIIMWEMVKPIYDKS